MDDVSKTKLRDLGLAVAHDKGVDGPGRWTWRPTAAARVIMEAEPNER